jgi:hypothetical protein
MSSRLGTRALYEVPFLLSLRVESTDSDILFPMSDSHPLTGAFVRLFVDRDSSVTLTESEQQQLNVDMQTGLGPEIERIRTEQRLAFENARKIALN